MTTHVTETGAAPSVIAVKHFQEMLAFETDDQRGVLLRNLVHLRKGFIGT